VAIARVAAAAASADPHRRRRRAPSRIDRMQAKLGKTGAVCVMAFLPGS